MEGNARKDADTTCIMLCKVLETLIQKHGFNGAEKQLKESPDLWKGMLVKTQTPTMLETFNILADYQLDNALYFFRSRIEDAFSSKNYCSQSAYDRSRRGKNDSIFERLDVTFTFEQAEQQSIAVKGATGKNDSIFERLDVTFTFEQAEQQSIAVKGATATHETVKQMLKNWKRQGLICVLPDMRYQKVSPTV